MATILDFLPEQFNSSGEEGQNRFSRHGGHLGFRITTIIAIFDLQVVPITSFQVLRQLAFWFRRRSAKQIFKMVAFLDF